MIDIRLLLSFFSLGMTLIAFIIYIIFNVKVEERKMIWITIPLGIVICYFSKTVLFDLVSRILLMIPSLSPMLNDQFLSALISFSVKAILFAATVKIVNWYFLKNDSNKINNIVSFSLGVSIVDVIGNIVPLAFSNFIYFVQIKSSEYVQVLIQQLGETEALQLMETYNSYPNSYFLYLAIAVLLIISSNHLLFAVLKQKKYICLKIFLIYIFNQMIFYGAVIKVSYFVCLLVLVYVIIQFYIAEKVLTMRAER